jgi:hypothetical protein
MKFERRVIEDARPGVVARRTALASCTGLDWWTRTPWQWNDPSECLQSRAWGKDGGRRTFRLYAHDDTGELVGENERKFREAEDVFKGHEMLAANMNEDEANRLIDRAKAYTGCNVILTDSRVGWPWKSMRVVEATSWKRASAAQRTTSATADEQLRVIPVLSLKTPAGISAVRAGVPNPWPDGWGKSMRASSRLPIEPIWPGFVGSTVLFCTVFASCWYISGGARQWLRRRRGLCEGCGYVMAGLATCPECGLGRHVS